MNLIAYVIGLIVLYCIKQDLNTNIIVFSMIFGIVLLIEIERKIK